MKLNWCVHYETKQETSMIANLFSRRCESWVIWYNSLGDSLFQTYVMNFVEIVIKYYLRITSRVSQAITNCTHYTRYFLLNLVHDIVCDVVLLSKIKCSLILMQNMFNVSFLRTNWLKNLFFEDLGWIQVFLKNF